MIEKTANETPPQIVLRKAREFLKNPEWWWKGALHIGDRSHCILTACAHAAAATPNGDDREALDYLLRVVNVQGQKDLVVWNDDPEVTHDMLMGVLDRAYELAGNQQKTEA